jgi:hypothetical protein
MTRPEEIAQLLHIAADVIGHTKELENDDERMELAEAGGIFIRESTITDEHDRLMEFSPENLIGYGIMLGWMAREMS